MYNDPSGELFFLIPLVGYFWSAVIVGATIGLASYTIGLAATGNLDKWSIGGALKSMFWGGVGGAITFGIGSIFSSSTTGLTAIGTALKSKDILWLAQGIAHGVSQGVLSVVQGGDFWQGAAGGFFGSIGASGWSSVAGSSGVSMIAFGALSGGIGAELSGGNFWQGAVTGGMVAGLNHAMHSIYGPDDPPGKKKTPGDAVKEYLNSIKQDIIDGFANFGDALDMTGDWFTGSGSSNRTITTDRIVNSLKDAPAVERARDYWYAKADRLNSSKVQVTGYAGKFGLKGLVNSGFSPLRKVYRL